MAETLVFSIPAPAAGEVAAKEVNWYQSTDGETWGANPVDTILVADLPQDPDTLKYTWASTLADASKWHMLKTESSSGVMGVHGTILPPRGYAPIRLCTVTNDENPIVDAAGRPIPNLKVRFRLFKNGLPVTATDTTAGGRIPTTELFALTDNNGVFLARLWPTDRGAAGFTYRTWTGLTGDTPFHFALPTSDTPYQWGAVTL